MKTYQICSDSAVINAVNVQNWITQFNSTILPKRQELASYYDGENVIVKQGAVKNRPNYKINVNMAKYITDVATSYAFGKDITYSSVDEQTADALDKILDINKSCNIGELDFNVAGDMSCYGIGYQLVLLDEENGNIEDRIRVKRLNPENAFIVVDDSVLAKPICGVYLYNYVVNNIQKTRVYVYDHTNLYIFNGTNGALVQESVEAHNMGQVPIIQSLNNDDATGDYEPVKDLLDAISLSVSNNTDDLQSIANALLCATGGKLSEEQIELINKHKSVNLPIGAKLEWVVKNLNPEATKQHLDKLLEFLFQISEVPDLSDDAFGGTQSGVAMQYKLWGINQLWATKTKKYTKAIYSRLQIFMHLLQYEINRQIDLKNAIKIDFYKNLPTDASEEYEMVKALKDVVSNKTLLQHIGIVEDVDAEIEQIRAEKEEELDSFGFNNNNELENGEE